MSMFDVAE